jgi:hypothetical protein
MTRLDTDTKLKLREMGVVSLLNAFGAQDDELALGLPFAERVRLAVDDAHAIHTQTQVEGLIKRAKLRYPNAELRGLDLIEERGLDRSVIAGLGTCGFVERRLNVVFQGPTGSGKSFLGSALGRAACQNRHRVHYIRMPDLGAAWNQVKDNPTGRLGSSANGPAPLSWSSMNGSSIHQTRKCAACCWRSSNDATTPFPPSSAPNTHRNTATKRLGGGVHADAIMDRIVHNTHWIETGTFNMREHQSTKP